MSFNKEDLHPEHQQFYTQMESSMTTEAFEIWFNNVLNLKDMPKNKWHLIKAQSMPDKMFKEEKKSNAQEALEVAREAVSKLGSSSNTKKAVEALADAFEESLK